MAEKSLEQWMHELQSEPAFLDEKTLTTLVERRVEQLIADNPDLLFSYLYRLDVDEHKIQAALAAGSGIAHALARLIVERQKTRISTKSKYRKESKEGDEETFNPVDF